MDTSVKCSVKNSCLILVILALFKYFSEFGNPVTAFVYMGLEFRLKDLSVVSQDILGTMNIFSYLSASFFQVHLLISPG